MTNIETDDVRLGPKHVVEQKLTLIISEIVSVLKRRNNNCKE